MIPVRGAGTRSGNPSKWWQIPSKPDVEGKPSWKEEKVPGRDRGNNIDADEQKSVTFPSLGVGVGVGVGAGAGLEFCAMV